ncbi:MAG: protein translocase subunit SecD [bacterium]
MKKRQPIIFVIALIILAAVISAPKKYPVNFSIIGKEIKFELSSPEIHMTRPFVFDRTLNIKQGLDLQGGVEVTLSADMKDVAESNRKDALESAKEVIARRVDLFGIAEPVINTKQIGSDYRIAVALPGIDDPQAALDLIGQTAQLTFSELPAGTDSATYANLVPTELSGKDLQKATVQFNSQTGKPEVGLQFSEEGGNKFATITERNVNKPLAIMLDGMPISAPVVQQKIEGGKASINGNFTIEDAKKLVVTLNAGALPVPIQIIEQKNIAPTLGADSITKSLRAGFVGLGVVALFMILMYGWLGFIADLGLIVYGLLTLSIYKLVPITITLPGLAGFILSIGMAVDSNILVFERMKEEIRKGHPWQEAMELGFGKAWDSIKDANVASLITTFILFNPLDWSFLNSSGMVRGFALTLFLGIVISLFTGIVVTRTLLRTLYGRK